MKSGTTRPSQTRAVGWLKKVLPYGQKSDLGASMQLLFPASKRESPNMNNAAWFSGNLARQVYGIVRRVAVAQKKSSIQKCMLRLAMSVLVRPHYCLKSFFFFACYEVVMLNLSFSNIQNFLFFIFLYILISTYSVYFMIIDLILSLGKNIILFLVWAYLTIKNFNS